MNNSINYLLPNLAKITPIPIITTTIIPIPTQPKLLESEQLLLRSIFGYCFLLTSKVSI